MRRERGEERTIRRWLAAGCLLAALAVVRPVAALELTAEAGFQRRVTRNAINPLRITVKTDRESFTGTVEIMVRHRDFDLQRIPVVLDRNDELEFVRYLDYPDWPLQVRLLDDNDSEVRSLLTQSFQDQMLSDQVHILEISRDPLPLLGAATFQFPDPSGGATRRAVVSHLAPDEIPDHPLGLEGANVIILGDLAWDEVPKERRAAITGWVARGGLLIVRGGSAAEALNQSWLAPLLPLRNLTAGTREAAPLLNLTDPQEAPWLAGVARDRRFPAYQPRPGTAGAPSLVSNPSGAVGDKVIAWGVRYGLGQVRLLAFDPGDQPFRGERATSDLLFATDDYQLFPQAPEARHAGQALTIGTLTRMAERKSPPMVTMVVFLGAYLIAVGPLNFWLLGLLKKREWAWVTIPVIVFFFTTAMYATGRAALGTVTLQRELRLTTYDVAAGVEVRETCTGIFSAGSDDYELTFPRGTVYAGEVSDDYADPIAFLGIGPEKTEPFRIAQWTWRFVRSASNRPLETRVAWNPATGEVAVTGDLDLRGGWLALDGKFHILAPAGGGRFQLGPGQSAPADPIMRECPWMAPAVGAPAIFLKRGYTAGTVAVAGIGNGQGFELLTIFPEALAPVAAGAP